MAKGRKVKERKRILMIGDAVAHTGFSTVLHSIADQLKRTWDVSVLGVNYLGDPHHYQYPIFPASTGGDIYGLRRLPGILDTIKPNVVFIINDPWVAKEYIPIIKEKDIPIALYMPVDSPNVRKDFADALNQASVSIGYTQFAVDELTKAGLTTETAVIPHGIDLSLFGPLPKAEARSRVGLPEDWYVVGCVGRNQPRKRLDLVVRYFALWAKDKPVNVKLYYHGALHDLGWDLLQLCDYYGINDRLIITSPNITSAVGVPPEVMKYIYNCFDVHVSATLGEGWGLCQAEGAACRIAEIVPDWSALHEWMAGAAHFVPCTSTFVNTGGINTIGGVADEQQFIQALEKMYTDKKYREEMATKAYTLISKPQYRWENIASSFDKIFRRVAR